METIKRLTAADICKGEFAEGEKKCALGWIFEATGYDHAAEVRLMEALEDRIGGANIVAWNDSRFRRKATIAATLNATFQELGYELTPA